MDLLACDAGRLVTCDMTELSVGTFRPQRDYATRAPHITKPALITALEAKLTDALLANTKLREETERLIAAYVEPDSDRPAIINELIALFDGPQQREAQRLAAEALSAAGESIA
jgi:hypothetical protein